MKKKYILLFFLFFISFYKIIAQCPVTISPAGPVTICAGSTTSLNVSGASSYAWSPSGSLSSSTSANPTAAPTSTTTYTVTGTGGGAGGCTATITVIVNSLPIVTISPLGPVTICAGSNTSLSVSGASTYSWSPSGSLSSATSANPIASPTSTTTYTVTGTGSCGTATTTITVNVNPSPILPVITITNNNSCAGTSVGFSTPAQAGVVFTWNFGDGSPTINGASVSHIYNPTPGSGNQTYTVTVTATNAAGCTTIATQTVTVHRKPNARLISGAGTTFTTFFNGDTTFYRCLVGGASSANIRVDDASNPSSLLNAVVIWGDGNTNAYLAPLPSPMVHNYATGIYNLQYIVTNTYGCSDTTNYKVFVGSTPAGGIIGPGSTSGCSPQSFSFNISGIASNPPGTVYTITFNDGSPPLIYNSPPPSSITHLFTNTSCGTTSSNGSTTFPNSFSASFVAQNPCGISAGSVVPIYISTPVTPTFTITPSSPVCINTTLTMTDNTIGQDIVAGNCMLPDTRVWLISPSTGWSTTGLLGSTNGFVGINYDITSWTSGSQNLPIIFTSPGTYSITMLTGNSCGEDTLVQTVCIQAPPTPSFTATPLIGCTPLVVNFTNTSTSLPTCGPLTRLWTVTKTGSTCIADSISDFVYIGGTNSGSLNPIIRFNNQGTYIVTLTLTNICGAFTTAPLTITVKRKPQVSLTVPANICLGQTISPTSTVTNCATSALTYLWNFAGGTPASSTLAIPPAVSFSTAGPHNVSLAVTNECGTTTVTSVVNVLLLPIANAGPDIQICSGATSNLGAASVAGLTYQWSPTTGLSSTIVSNPTITLTNAGVVATTATYTVVVTNAAGCSSTDIVIITVNPLPNVTFSSAPQTICSGQSTSLVNLLSTTAGVTFSWTSLAGGAGGVSASGTSTIPVQTLTNTTSSPITVVYTATASYLGCVGASANYTIIVNPIPAITTAPLTQTVCEGSSSTAVAWTSGVAGTTYSWTGSSASGITGFTVSGTGNLPSMILNNPAFTQGSVVYPVTPTANGCAGSAVNYTILVNPLPDVIVPAAQTICSGQTSVLVTLGSNVAGTTYAWTASSAVVTGFTPSGTGSIPAQTLINSSATPGTVIYTITPTANGCAGPAVNYSITVNSAPTVSFSIANQTICSGQTSALVTLTSLAGATIAWTCVPPAGITGAITSGTTTIPVQTLINTTSSPIVVTYAATATTSGGAVCPGTVQNYTITVNPIPSATATPSAQIICSGTITGINLTSPVLGTTFSWTVVQAGVSGATAGTGASIAQTLITTGPSTGTATYTITPLANGCPGLPITVIITVNPLPNVTFSSAPQTICSGQSTSLVNLLSTTAGVTFSWTSLAGGAGGVSASGTSTIPVQTLTNTTSSPITVVYTATASYLGCVGASANYTSTVNLLPVVAFTNPTIECISSLILFTNNTTGASTYSWNFGDGGTSTSTAPTHIYTAAGTYTIQLIATSIFGCIDSISSTIQINEIPLPNFTTLPNIGCAPLTVSFTNNSMGVITSYLWDFGNGNTSALAIAPNQVYLQGISDTTYFVTLTVTNNCGSSTFIDSVLVQPTPVVSFGTNVNSGCSPLNIYMINNSTGNATNYIWNYGDGSPSITTTNPDTLSHTFLTGIADTTYTITLIGVNACGNDTVTHTILVHPNTVTAFFNSSSIAGCAEHTVTFTDLSIGATFVSWDFGDGNVSTVLNPVHTYITPGTYTCYEYINNGCSYDTASVVITIYPPPVLSFTTNVPTVCGNQPISFINTSTGAAGYSWNFGDGGTSLLYSPTHIFAVGGTYNVTLTATSISFGCIDSITHVVNIDSLPVPTISSNVAFGCVALAVNFSNTSTNANFYQWDFGDGNSSILLAPSHTYVTTGIYNVTMIATNLNGCVDSSQLSINVYPKPTAGFTLSSNYSCSFPATVNFTNTSSGAVGYQWDFGNGAISSLTNPTSAYSSNSSNTITLIVTSSFGCSDTATNNFSVYQPPIASFTPDIYSGCAPLSVSFNNTSLSSTNYLWNFGDGDTATNSSPTHIFQNQGIYSVTLIAYNATPCSDTSILINSITVYPKPIADFTFDQIYTDGLPNGTIDFQNLSVGANSYIWNFGDGEASTLISPEHQYYGIGNYNVILIASNVYNCKDTAQKYVEPDYFSGLFVPNALMPISGIGDSRLFLPKGKSLAKYHLEIFDTWGAKLFESYALDAGGSPSEGWDGTYNGSLCQQDVYVWKIEATFKNGSIWLGKKYSDGKLKQTGSVTLVK